MEMMSYAKVVQRAGMPEAAALSRGWAGQGWAAMRRAVAAR